MKKMFVVTYLSVFVSVNISFGQSSFKNEEIKIEYIYEAAIVQKTIEFTGVSSVNLRWVLNGWLTEVFNNPSHVLIKNENEVMVIQGIEPGITLQTFPRTLARLKYNFNIEVDDNMICVRMSEMKMLTELDNTYPIETYIFKPEGIPESNRQSRNIVKQVLRIANVLINSLETSFAENGLDRKW